MASLRVKVRFIKCKSLTLIEAIKAAQGAEGYQFFRAEDQFICSQ